MSIIPLLEQSAFEPETIELLEHVSSIIGPVLEEKRLNDRWIAVKLLESLRMQLARLFGPGNLVRKLIVGALVIAVLATLGLARVIAHLRD